MASHRTLPAIIALTCLANLVASCKDPIEPHSPEKIVPGEPGPPAYFPSGSPPACPAAAELDALPLPEAAPTDGAGLCQDGWCWVSHAPQGHELVDVWSHPAAGAWFVGQAGTVLQRQAGTWTWHRTPTRSTLRGVWGASLQNLWAVGDGGALLHYDGASWTAAQAPGPATDLLDVEGAAADEVWAAGRAGRLLRWDGAAWTEVPSGTDADLLELSILSAEDVWVSARGVGLLRCTPQGCVSQEGPAGIDTQTAQVRMWEGADERWVSFSPRDPPYTWRDGRWSASGIGAFPSALRYIDLWVGGPQDAWLYTYAAAIPSLPTVALFHWDGTEWRAAAVPGGPYRSTGSVWSAHTLGGSGPADLWAFGSAGALLHWDGTTWQELRPKRAFRSARGKLRVPEVGYGLRLSASSDGAAVWANERGGLFDGDTWPRSRTESWDAYLVAVPALGGLRPDGFGAARRREGARDEHVLEGRLEGDPAPSRARIHGSADDNVWALTEGRAWAWDGVQWRSRLNGVGELFAVWTGASTDTWVAAAEQLMHWNGTEWRTFPTQGFTAAALWASWGGDVWAAGMRSGAAALFHWDGRTWSEVSSPALENVGALEAMTGRCPSQVYAVGSGGAVLAWDGAAWTRLSVPTTLDLYGVAIVGEELWIAGASGAVLRQQRP